MWKKRGQAGYTLQADLDQETGEAARVVLDAWSKPAPAVPATPARAERGWAEQPDQPSDESECDGRSGVVEVPGSRDDRPHHVRMHDAFGDVLKAILNSGDLPACGGTPAATVWHIKDTQLRDRYGFAVSEHGTLLPVGDALRACDQSAAVRADREQQGRPALPRPDHPDRHPRPDRRPSRARPRLFLPGL